MRYTGVKPFLALLMLLSVAGVPASQPAVPRDLTGTDLAGQTHQLIQPKGKATVLFFVGIECPISNSNVPQINLLTDAYDARGVAFYVVYSGTDVQLERAKKHAKEYGFLCPTLFDPKCELARSVGASMTLEAAVILPDGTLAYRGRFDDQYITLGKKRFAPTRHDLKEMIDAVMSGQAIEPRFTQAVGCSIVMPEMKK